MEKYGPALIQGFKVESKFNSDSWQHIGGNTNDSIGFHAMVLIGYRYNEDGEPRYLIQNWWKSLINKITCVILPAHHLRATGHHTPHSASV
jgi:hypothetical protein